MPKRGILLFNLGGPWSLKEVKPFLYRLFSDSDILIGLPSQLGHCLPFFFSQAKGHSSVEMYRQIGGKSPQLDWTRIQARNLQSSLNGKTPGDLRIEIAMRASCPTIRDALVNLKAWGAEE